MPEEIKTEEKQVVVATPEVDPIAAKDAEIAKITEDRDNYRTIALARKGKLPADSEILGDDFDALIDAKVATALADKELVRKEQERQAEIARVTKENQELRLALKNRPESGLGSDSGQGQEVKDNVFSATQLEAMKLRALRLKIDPDKYIEGAKKNLAKK